MSEDEPYEHRMSENFVAFRRNVVYDKHLLEVSRYNFMNKLSFTQSKSWFMYLRYGFLEVGIEGYKTIVNEMQDFV